MSLKLHIMAEELKRAIYNILFYCYSKLFSVTARKSGKAAPIAGESSNMSWAISSRERIALIRI